MILIQQEATISAEEFRQVLIDSTLGDRRPIEDLPRLELMIKNSNLIVTARTTGKLIGIARSVTDFAYCCYVSDLAVAVSHQHQGIGRSLLDYTQKLLHPNATLILLSAPKAIDYYPKIGFEKHPAAYYRTSTN